MNSNASTTYRWFMIFMLILSFIQLSLNWFVVVPALPYIGQSYHATLPMLGLLVSLFFIGFGIFHIPTGFFSARYGVKNVFIAGIVLESLATLGCAFAPNYWVLGLMRVLSGAGAAGIGGCGFSLASVWFPNEQRKVAIGMLNGLGFPVGAAVALYLWVGINQAMGWQNGFILAAVIGLLLALACALFVRVPKDIPALEGSSFSWESTARVLKSRDLWGIGLGMLGGWGAWITVSELGPTYVTTHLHFSAQAAGLLSALVLFAGIPGGVLGGYVAERAKRFLRTMWLPAAIIALASLFMPVVTGAPLWILMLVIGFFLIFIFSPLGATSAEYHYIAPEDYATGFGLLLTLANVGGFVDPIIYSNVAVAFGTGWAWSAVGILAVLSWFGFLWAREPRVLKAAATLPKAEAL